jgi:hypothetical protein
MTTVGLVNINITMKRKNSSEDQTIQAKRKRQQTVLPLDILPEILAFLPRKYLFYLLNDLFKTEVRHFIVIAVPYISRSRKDLSFDWSIVSREEYSYRCNSHLCDHCLESSRHRTLPLEWMEHLDDTTKGICVSCFISITGKQLISHDQLEKYNLTSDDMQYLNYWDLSSRVCRRELYMQSEVQKVSIEIGLQRENEELMFEEEFQTYDGE